MGSALSRNHPPWWRASDELAECSLRFCTSTVAFSCQNGRKNRWRPCRGDREREQLSERPSARRFEAGHARFAEKDAQGGSEPIEALPAAHRPVTSDSLGAGTSDFPALLRRHGLLNEAALLPPAIVNSPPSTFTPTQATTILAFKFTGGVLVAGDRRATAGKHGRLRSGGQGARDRPALDHGHCRRAGDGLEMARVPEHSLRLFGAPSSGNERGWQGARPLEAAAR